MNDEILAPPKEVLDQLDALRALRDLRTSHKNAGSLRTTFGTFDTDQKSADAAVAQTKKIARPSTPKMSLLMPRP